MLSHSLVRPVVSFDLDGTLLRMDEQKFMQIYFAGLCASIPEISPDKLIASVWAGTKAMVANDGRKTNREVFADVFSAASGLAYEANEDRFHKYYETDFHRCREACDTGPLARTIVETLRAKGYTVIIATNPIFPKVATYARLRWLGLEPASFPLVTTFETARHSKPNPAYYADILHALNLSPNDCLHIGNDAVEDGAAGQIGITTVIVTDCLLHGEALKVSKLPTATLKEVAEWAHSISSRN